ncbi:transposable element Tc1 transposase [Trichonephila clavipes]|nr:transposable element Tc1 transposase [Trichonephila clavipes]
MPRHRIQAHYEQLPEFERGNIIEQKDGGCANWRITRHMGRSNVAIRRCRLEFCFQLCPDNNRRRVFRWPRHRANPAFPMARHTYPQQGVLNPPGLIFQQDNAEPNTTRVAMNCLLAYQTLPFPARSRDPPPNQHISDMMGRQLHLPGNFDYQTRQLEQIWQEIPQENIRVFYHSMPHRVVACI